MTTLNLRSFIGKRIEIPVHYDMWARGARFGLVTAIRRGSCGVSDCLLVKMDHPQIKKRFRLWAGDIEYVKVID
jgi:hypothetical protein